jgi:M6 family metalloprotease-like protein
LPKLRVSLLLVIALSVVTFSISAIPESHACSAASGSDKCLEQHPYAHYGKHSETSYSQPILGAQALIVLPVKFSDKPQTKTIDYINKMVFSKMNEYFLEVSYGRMWFVGSILPKWYQLPHQMSYYGAPGVGFHDKGWDQLIQDSMKMADNDVDYRRYNYVMIVHSGADEAAMLLSGSDNIWSFSYLGSMDVKTDDGWVRLSMCAVSEFDTLGVFAHETGHMLGLPDLYDYNKKETFVGGWDLMAEGANNGPLFGLLGSSPAHISSWGKMKLGWIDQNQVRTVRPGDSATVEIEQLQAKSSSTKAVIMPIAASQFFLIEVREKIGFDKWLPRQLDTINVLVYYIDESISSGEGPVRLQNVEFRPSTTTSAGKVEGIQKDPYRLAITILAVALHSFKVKVDYFGYALMIRARMANVPIRIDDQSYLTDSAGNLNVKISYATHQVLASQVVARGENTRLVFTGWSDGVASPDREISVQSDTTVGLAYKTQHHLSINSQYGITTGVGWYDQNSQATFSVTNPIQDTARAGVRYSVVGYSGDMVGSGSSGTTIMDRPKTITFNWVRQYLLTVSSNTVAITSTGSIWYNEGQSATVVAGDTGGYRFLGWTLDGAARLGSSITVQMYAPHTLKANYARPSTFAQNVEVASSSSLSRYSYDAKNRVVSFVVSGDSGSLGFSTVRIPKQLLWSESPTIKIDGQVPLLASINDGGSVWIVSFSYTHSDHLVAIPEFHQLSLMLASALCVTMILTCRARRPDKIPSWRAS